MENILLQLFVIIFGSIGIVFISIIQILKEFLSKKIKEMKWKDMSLKNLASINYKKKKINI